MLAPIFLLGAHYRIGLARLAVIADDFSVSFNVTEVAHVEVFVALKSLLIQEPIKAMPSWRLPLHLSAY
jgi:hypothetical protein